jgi:heat shock protein HslJ
MKTWISLALAALVGGLLLAACSAAPAATPTPAPAGRPADLAGSNWTLTELNGAAPVAGSPANLQFDAEGRVGGTTGCNNYGGSYSADGAALSVGQLFSTKMACEGALMQQEQTYLDILGRTTGFAVAGDTLTLTADGGETLVYTRA